MAVNHQEYGNPTEAPSGHSRADVRAYRTLIAASLVSVVPSVLLTLVLALKLFGADELPLLVSIPEALKSSQALFWIVLASGILSVVFWAGMVRQKSVNEVRLATMKFELAEMALRSEQRVRAING